LLGAQITLTSHDSEELDCEQEQSSPQRGWRPQRVKANNLSALSHQQSAFSFRLLLGNPHVESRILCGPQMGSPPKVVNAEKNKAGGESSCFLRVYGENVF
jgi:hypothetical protein